MIKKLLFLLCLILSASLHAQNYVHVTFDTNGPMGKCLFPQNEKGEIIMTEIVESPYSADTIKGLMREFIYEQSQSKSITIKEPMEGVSKMGWTVTIPVGKEAYGFTVWGGTVFAGLRDASNVTFNLLIEVRDHKYRYTLSNFYTRKRRIHGEGKTEGPTNMIYWQRVNSLRKERDKEKKQADKAEKEDLINREILQYRAEWAAISAFVEALGKAGVEIEDF